MDRNLVSHFLEEVRAGNMKRSQKLPQTSKDRILEGLGNVLGGSYRLNCVLDASWERLGGFWMRLEDNLSHLGAFLRRLKGVWGALGTSQASF